MIIVSVIPIFASKKLIIFLNQNGIQWKKLTAPVEDLNEQHHNMTFLKHYKGKNEKPTRNSEGKLAKPWNFRRHR